MSFRSGLPPPVAQHERRNVRVVIRALVGGDSFLFLDEVINRKSRDSSEPTGEGVGAATLTDGYLSEIKRRHS